MAALEAAATYQSVQKYFITPVHTDQLLALVASDRNTTQISLWGEEEKIFSSTKQEAQGCSWIQA